MGIHYIDHISEDQRRQLSLSDIEPEGIDWTDVGIELVDPCIRDQFLAFLARFRWDPALEGIGRNLSFTAGYAVQEFITQVGIPSVTHLAGSPGQLWGDGHVIGVIGHYTNVSVRCFAIDIGADVLTPVCMHRYAPQIDLLREARAAG